MSIDWLWDLDRAVEGGRVYYGCQSVGRNQWAIARSVDELRAIAKRAADHKRLPVDIVRIVSPHETIAGDLYLVPIDVGDPGHRGEPNVKWTCVETREAADMMKDVRKGPSPIFGIQIEETIDPTAV
ncbi:MAG: hypothetical protein ACOX2O_05810 [Bdellovibrionota bacterium]|jgi:hypothetical protein